MIRRTAALVLFLTLLFTLPFYRVHGVEAGSRADARQRAATLARSAEQRLALDAADQHMQAITELTEACQLAPDDPRYPLALGRAMARMRIDAGSREQLAKAAALDPRDPTPLPDLVDAWRREWLHYARPAVIDTILGLCARWTRLHPYSADAWLAQVPFLVERGDLDGAAVAAGRAMRYGRRRADTWLAVAMVAWRRGEIELADSLFAVTVPRLHPDLGAWFAAPHALARDAPPPASGQDSVSWAPLDPDPTTPQNESRLEYWSRTTQAWLLMNDPLRPGLDSRAELMRRYGRPAAVVNAPLDSPQHRMYNALRASMYPDWRGPARGPGVPEFGYPYNAQAWEYPDLGARFVLEDRALNGHYEMPFVRLDEPVPGPNPNMIAARGDLMMLGDGEIILPALPPREQRLPVVVAFRRFESDSGPRLFGQIETAGGPADTLWMRWVVNDRHGVAVARGEDRAGLSSCDPVARRVATFSAAVPPGEYEVAVSLRDSRHRRGWIRGTEQLDPPGAGLALSDLVVTCSEASNAVSGGTVRLEVDPDPATAGTPLTAYFEVYRLARGSNHRSRFEYGFAVVPDGGRWSPDAATPPVNSVTREEEFEGGVRRQFLSVPVSWLPRGAYRLRVTVRDLVNGATATSEAPFVRL